MTETDAVDADVEVSILEPGEVVEHDLPWSASAPLTWRALDGDRTWLRARYQFQTDWAEFVFDGRGESVWVSRSPGIALSEIRELLLGQMFSCLASQRGLTCLHASVVRLGARVVAMIGPSGAGKSSTALALVKWGGGQFVADDVAVLSDRDGRVSVAVGAPRLRMREAPARALLVEYESLPPVWGDDRPIEPKRYLEIEDVVTADSDIPLPVDALYFMEPWSEDVAAPFLRDVSPVVALPRLMGQRHMWRTIGTRADAIDFDRLARLLRAAAAREVFRPTGLDTMPQTVETIAADVRALA